LGVYLQKQLTGVKDRWFQFTRSRTLNAELQLDVDRKKEPRRKRRRSHRAHVSQRRQAADITETKLSKARREAKKSRKPAISASAIKLDLTLRKLHHRLRVPIGAR